MGEKCVRALPEELRPAEGEKKGGTVQEESVFNRITREYYHLTASEKKLAAYIVANGQATQGMSISRLAEACGVAEATISRFCRRMGYRGYSAFRLAIAAATAGRSSSDPLHGEIQPEDTVPDLCAKLAGVDSDAIRETQSLIIPESIIAAANILTAADKVYRNKGNVYATKVTVTDLDGTIIRLSVKPIPIFRNASKICKNSFCTARDKSPYPGLYRSRRYHPAGSAVLRRTSSNLSQYASTAAEPTASKIIPIAGCSFASRCMRRSA